MPETLIVTVLVSLVSGGLSGSILSLYVGNRRDRQQRLRAFAGFLRSWRAEISNAPPASGGLVQGANGASHYRLIRDQSFLAYQNRIPTFSVEIENVRGCFRDKAKFDSLAIRLKTLKEEDWQDKHNKVLKPFDDFIAFT
jgi:hypothetical protein